MDCDVVRFDSRIDFVIIKNSIITKNITLLQNSFCFETYVRNKADKIIEIIKKLDFVSDITSLSNLSNGQKLTTAKKLIKLKVSPVLNISKKVLFAKIKEDEIYNKLIKFDETGNKIIISSQKSVKNLLKVFQYAEKSFFRILKEKKPHLHINWKRFNHLILQEI